MQVVMGGKLDGGGRCDGDAEAGIGPEDCRARIVVEAGDFWREVVRGEGVEQQLLEAAVEDQGLFCQLLHGNLLLLGHPVEL